MYTQTCSYWSFPVFLFVFFFITPDLLDVLVFIFIVWEYFHILTSERVCDFLFLLLLVYFHIHISHISCVPGMDVISRSIDRSIAFIRLKTSSSKMINVYMFTHAFRYKNHEFKIAGNAYTYIVYAIFSYHIQ